MRELVIDGRRVADDEPCYVIAELGSNHGGDVATAEALIAMAAKAGASAVKLQKKALDRLYTQALLNTSYDHEHSYGKTYGAHKAALEFGWAEFVQCQVAARQQGVTFFATAFDEPSVDFLVQLGVPALKLHSGALTDEPLISYAAQFGKPIILSTGAGDLSDIDRAVGWLKDCPHALLHCTASYPLQPVDAHLLVIPELRARYPETVIGWSSHHPGLKLSYAAYVLGARILEQHVTLSRALKGTDHGFSLEPKALQTLVEDLADIRTGFGDGIKRFLACEQKPIAKMRRWLTNAGEWKIGTDAEQEPKYHA